MCRRTTELSCLNKNGSNGVAGEKSLPQSIFAAYHDHSNSKMLVETVADRKDTKTKAVLPIRHIFSKFISKMPTRIKSSRELEYITCQPKLSSLRASNKRHRKTKIDDFQRRSRSEGYDAGYALHKINNARDSFVGISRRCMLDELRLCKMSQEERKICESFRRSRYCTEREVFLLSHRVSKTLGRERTIEYEDRYRDQRTEKETGDVKKQEYPFVEKHTEISKFSDPLRFLPLTGEGCIAYTTQGGNSNRLTDKERTLMRTTWNDLESELRRQKSVDIKSTENYSTKTKESEYRNVKDSNKDVDGWRNVSRHRGQMVMGCSSVPGLQCDKQSNFARRNCIIDQTINCCLVEEKRREVIVRQEQDRRVTYEYLQNHFLIQLKEQQRRTAQRIHQYDELRKTLDHAMKLKATRLPS